MSCCTWLLTTGYLALLTSFLSAKRGRTAKHGQCSIVLQFKVFIYHFFKCTNSHEFVECTKMTIECPLKNPDIIKQHNLSIHNLLLNESLYPFHTHILSCLYSKSTLNLSNFSLFIIINPVQVHSCLFPLQWPPDQSLHFHFVSPSPPGHSYFPQEKQINISKMLIEWI